MTGHSEVIQPAHCLSGRYVTLSEKCSHGGVGRDRLEEALADGCVHVRFTGTRGETELGVRMDRERSVTSGARLWGGGGDEPEFRGRRGASRKWIGDAGEGRAS